MMLMHEQMSELREENIMLRQRIDNEAERNTETKARVDLLEMPPPRQNNKPATYAEKLSMQQTTVKSVSTPRKTTHTMVKLPEPEPQQLQLGQLRARQEINSTRKRSESQSSMASSNDFQLQPKEKRRLRRRQLLNRGTKISPVDSNLKGAPLPMRDLFAYRVMKPSTCDDIRAYIKKLDINATLGDIKLVAHQNAKYNSFHVSCDVVSYKHLMNPDMWIEGICVDKYRQKANKSDNNNNGGE